MSPRSPLDIVATSRSSGLTRDLIEEILQGVQDEGELETPSQIAGEVRRRLDRLKRAQNNTGG
jgi:hypothetical protein